MTKLKQGQYKQYRNGEYLRKTLSVLICLLLFASCRTTRFDLPAQPLRVSAGSMPSSNILEGAIENYDPAADYFPDKLSFRHSRQLKIEYFKNYKVLTFTPNIHGDVLRYVLVQRGTPTPDLPGIDHQLTKVINVPVRRVALGSMRYGGAAELIGVIDQINLVSGLRAITTPSILQRIKDGRILENYSTELLMERDVDAAMNYYSVNGESLAQGKNRELGITVIGMAEYLEETPLSKSEWLKFFAVFFNREKVANQKFDEIASNYNDTIERVRAKLDAADHRPKVLFNYKDGDSWAVCGGLNAFAKLIEDAGGDYLFKDLPYRNSLYELPYETVYDRGAEADVWIVGPDKSSAFADGKPRFDERLKKLKAIDRFFVSYNPTVDRRNPWWDQALINPQIELLDYVKAIHPDLVPEHEFRLLRQIK